MLRVGISKMSASLGIALCAKLECLELLEFLHQLELFIHSLTHIDILHRIHHSCQKNKLLLPQLHHLVKD